jgi:tetratricopeptide (TPR) repeat protein
MTRPLPFWLVAVPILAGAPLAAQHAEAQHSAGSGSPDSTGRLYDRAQLGSFSRTVSTASRDAQAFFNQGIILMYAFDLPHARVSFQRAQALDSSCATCAFGEAWAWGPYLNEKMPASSAAPAYAAIERAKTLAPGRTTSVEAALIDAMATRYQLSTDSVTRLRLDSTYADAMNAVLSRFPKDLDVATLAAESLMLLEPRRGTWDLAKPSVRRIHQILGAALARDIRHPGACHLYIHATESTPDAGKAGPCAEFLGDAIPGASHVNHMPSHTWNRLGRWGDAVKANIAAWHSDQRAAVGQGFAIYPTHNLHMLLFAASMDGQGAIAEQAARDYAGILDGGVFARALVLVRFGRFGEVLALEDAPTQPIFRGLWLFARGYAHLRVGDPDNARAYLERVDSLARSIPDSIAFRGHKAPRLLGTVDGILRGEILRHEGRQADAIAALEAAVALQDSLTYDEPEPLPFSARDWLGAALLEAGRPADAERVYQAALVQHPHNGWALFGLAQALEAQGRTADARQARREFDQAWARSDTWIRASRF